MQLGSRIAIVTGASSGIGAAVAVQLAARGATVVAVARRKDKLDEVVARCGPSSVACAADVSSRDECERVVREAEDRFGRVDVLVNNAGISIHKSAAHTSVDDVDRIMAVNFFAPVAITTAALPGMLDRGEGSIVNVKSVAGYLPNPGEAAYGASKAALSRWSHGLSIDLHGSGVHVGVVSPGPIDTEIWSLDEELSYKGKLFPASVVADGVIKVIERELTHLTVPRRYGAPGAMYPLAGRPMRWGLRKYGG
jgi:short-subunit dehydrogenase